MQSARFARAKAQSLVSVLLSLFGIHAFAAAPVAHFEVVHVYRHDSSAFTQGLEYRNGVIYESTGQEGRSRVRAERLGTGRILRQAKLPDDIFGEGITVLGGRIYQLTWLGGKGFIYDAKSLRKLREFEYPGQGWGLTNDGSVLFMSDGTAEIRVWDPASLKELRRVVVHDGDQRIDQLNELEWIEGELWANVWHTDRIARISPQDGRVLGWIDAAGLLKPGETKDPEAVLNGIAYDAGHKRIFVTGKLWPKLFEVRVRR
jgi:glutamine cyclotransferase